MADRKAVNRYYPPDFDPTKHGSINKYRNSHPLRERAKRLSEGILVIRFEMPYNIWCGGCGKHIGMGVRYNAEKTKVGNYYTTPIYRFRMKCHLCDHYFEMETNPMDCDYTIVTGAYRKNQKWDMAENEQVLTEDRQTVKKLASDPMFKLEHGVEDAKKLAAVAPTLHELEQTQTSWKEDFDQNRMLRKKFRMEKSELKSAMAKDKELLSKSSLDIELVPEHDDDKKLASLMKYNTVETYDEKQKKKRLEISNRSIFSLKPSPTSASSVTSMSPRKGTPKERKNLEVQKRIGLLDTLRAAKRGRAGFEDFGSSPDRKITRHSTAIRIVTSQRGREIRDDDDETVNDRTDGDRSRQEIRKTVLPNVDEGSRMKSQALRGMLDLDEESQRASVAEHNRTCSLGEVHSPGSQDVERMTHGSCKEENMTNNKSGVTDNQDKVLSDSQISKTQQQHDDYRATCPPRTDQIRNSSQTVVQSVAYLGESSVNKDSEAHSKSLVSCDYSSSDGDE